MKITEELVQYIAELSRIRLDAKSTEKMRSELSAIVDYMEILNEVDTAETEALSHVFPVTNVMRDDEVKPSYKKAELTANAPVTEDGGFVVPKTVE